MASKFFLPVPEKCNPDIPSACCDGRRLAVRRGEFWWDYEREGWVSVMNPLRSMRDWRTIWAAGSNSNGDPYILDICPYCGCELPVLQRPTEP
jgi:hypothetical protein